ncbi:MAG TPA: SAV2148 family HEPN domain-containing protein, partial [Streptomyces sp.]|nr:SAV2148 family HEPN domain-containing protein [Streptomyces sp.]
MIAQRGQEGGARVGAGGLELPPGESGDGGDGEATDVPAGAVSLARPMEIGADLDWDGDAWAEVRT